MKRPDEDRMRRPDEDRMRRPDEDRDASDDTPERLRALFELGRISRREFEARMRVIEATVRECR